MGKRYEALLSAASAHAAQTVAAFQPQSVVRITVCPLSIHFPHDTLFLGRQTINNIFACSIGRHADSTLIPVSVLAT